MSDLINRQAALDALEFKWAGKAAIDAIKNLPSAQTERKKGKWIIVCSECGAQVPRDEWGNAMQSAYCPNCGARMVEGEEDELGDS